MSSKSPPHHPRAGKTKLSVSAHNECESRLVNSVPARVKWTIVQLRDAKLREQTVVDALAGYDRDLTAAEHDRLMLALRNIRAIGAAMTRWHGVVKATVRRTTNSRP